MVAAPIPRMTPVRSVTVRISHPLTARSLNPAQEGALNQVVRSYPKGREPPSRASRPEGSSARRWGRPSCQRVGSTSLSGHPPDAQGFNTKNASSAPSQSNAIATMKMGSQLPVVACKTFPRGTRSDAVPLVALEIGLNRRALPGIVGSRCATHGGERHPPRGCRAPSAGDVHPYCGPFRTCYAATPRRSSSAPSPPT